MIGNCIHCSRDFQKKRSDKRFCSDSCRSMANTKKSRQSNVDPFRETEYKGGLVNDVHHYSPLYCENNAKYLTMWGNVLKRTIYLDIQQNPSYSECVLNKEWYKFSNFKIWAKKHYKDGLHLDKDILNLNNKEYGPYTCVFVPQYINNMLKVPRKKSTLPLGVTSDRSGTFRATTGFMGSKISIGSYATAIEAHRAWQWKKAELLEKLVGIYAEDESFNSLVADALIDRAWKLRNQFSNNIETKEL